MYAPVRANLRGMPKSKRTAGIGIRRVDHIAIAAEDPQRAAEFWQRLFGLELDHWSSSPDEGYRVAQFHFPGRQVGLEVIGAYDEDSFVKRFIETRGAGMHHITVEVGDFDGAVEFLREEMGIEPFGEFEDFEWRQCFVHPRDTGGVLVQLYEWRPGRRPADWPD